MPRYELDQRFALGVKFSCFLGRGVWRAFYFVTCDLHQFRHTLGPLCNGFREGLHWNQMLVPVSIKTGFGDQNFNEGRCACLAFSIDCHNPGLDDVSTRELHRLRGVCAEVQEIPVPFEFQFTIWDFDCQRSSDQWATIDFVLLDDIVERKVVSGNHSHRQYVDS